MEINKLEFPKIRLWIYLLVACISLIFFARFSSAQDQIHKSLPRIITLKSPQDVAIDVGHFAVFMAENNQTLSLEDVRASKDWIPINMAHIDGAKAQGGNASTAPYNKGAPTWVHFTLKNDMPTERRIVLDTQRPDLKSLRIYQIVENGAPKKIILDYNDRQNFTSWPINNPELATMLSIPPNRKIDIYLRYVRTASEPMNLKLYSPVAYEKKVGVKSVWIGAFITVLATIVLITLLGLPALGWRIALSYVFYVSTVGLWFTGVTGHFFSIVSPNAPIFGHRAVEAFASLMFAAFLNMGRVLFKYKKINANYDKVLLAVIFANLFCALLILAFDIYEQPLLAYCTFVLMILSCVLYIANAIIAVRAKRYGAYAMLVGSLSLFVSVGIYRYVTMAVSSGDFSIPIGRIILIPPISFIEICCFAVAMIQGQIGIRRERDRAQKEAMVAVQEQLRLSNALQDAERSYREAQKKAKLRKERLTSVSHDLLQPLTSLRTILSDVKAMDTSKAKHMDEAFDYLETLARESLSSTSPMATPRPKNKFETFKVSAVADNTYTMFKDEAILKDLEFHYTPSDFTVYSIPIELMRVLNNLVSNAIKHTPSGEVLLRCQRVRGVKTITVQDTGTGMSAADLEKFLQAYNKGEGSSGTGLGLYQVKSMCESLGHTFSIESILGEGTTANIQFTAR